MRSDTKEEEFRHEQLNYQEQQIRVIQLIIDHDFENVHCKLSVVRLNTHYHALSYIWGEDEPTWPVYIDGKRLLVRRNLFDFLIHTKRRLAKTFYCCTKYFIDAICIDQNNIRERNHQVRQMADIYKSAVSVTSWLGSGDSTIEAFLDFAHLFSQHRRQIALNCQRGRFPVLESNMEMFLGETTPARFASNLDNFCNSDYWTRLWIVPEYVLPESVFISYGDRVVDGHQVLDVVQYLRDTLTKPQHRAPDNSMEPDRQLYNRIVKHSGLNVFIDHVYDNTFSRTSLADVIYYFGFNKCSDPRDRVFALTCLTSSTHDTNLIDYHISREQLFLQTIDSHLESLGGAEILGFAKYLSAVLEIDLPNISIDDFTVLLPNSPAHKNHTILASDIKAWDSRYSQSAPDLRFDEVDVSLEITGRRITRVRCGDGQYYELTQSCHVKPTYMITNRHLFHTRYSHDLVFDTALGVVDLLLIAVRTTWGNLINCPTVESNSHIETDEGISKIIFTHYSHCSAIDSSRRFGRPWYALSYSDKEYIIR